LFSISINLMIQTIRGIATRHFSSSTRKGPRHAHLLWQLRKRGCRTTIDKHGNIWVEKGSGSGLTLFSAHMDVDPRIKIAKLKGFRYGKNHMLHGVLDNSVGCYINLLLAQKGPKKGKAIYVFTASEEIHRNKQRKFCTSAREIVRELRKRRMKPRLCVAIDVTHPKLLKAQEKTDWTRKHEEIFDIKDKTCCYIDGYVRRKVRKTCERLAKGFKDTQVDIRKLVGHDEAYVYSKLCPSFAFGPVVMGRFDRPNQQMPIKNLIIALKFLRKI